MKKNTIITTAIITVAAASVTAYLLWKRNRNNIIMQVENDAQHQEHSEPVKHRPRKHVTNVFHNAKAAITSPQEVNA